MKWKKIKKGAIVICAIITMCISMTVFAAAQEPTVKIDGQVLHGYCYIKNSVLYAPIRIVCEKLGGDVAWDPVTKTASISTGIAFNKNDGCDIINNRIYAPIRRIASAFDKNVEWNEQDRTASIYVQPSILSMENIKTHTQDDIYWLSRIIHAEACCESMDGKIAVGNVIINRVDSDIFPDNIYDVIFDSKYGIQFTPVAIGTIYGEPDEECIEAAKRALDGENIVGNSLYFFNPELSTSFWIADNCEYITAIGTHEFYV